MSAVYNPTSTYHASITIPVDGDARTAASVNAAFQDLADSARFCRDHITGPNAASGVLIPPLLMNISSVSGTFTTTWKQIDTLIGAGSGSADNAIIDITGYMHHGATIDTLDGFLCVGQAHAGVPAALPRLSIKRLDVTTLGAVPFADHLSGSGGNFFPTPVSGAAWYSSGNMQKWTMVCDQNNVIDRSRYRYYAFLTDESGANSHTGNTYYGFLAKFSALP